jgi:hypothetical protein
MHSIVKRASVGAVLGGSLLFTGGMAIASAAPPQVQDGLVNVAVGDVTVLRNVQVEAVAQVLATVCPNLNVSDVNVLADQVDADRGTQQVADCTAFNEPVSLQQNGPGNSPNAPGQNGQGNGQGNANATGQR